MDIGRSIKIRVEISSWGERNQTVVKNQIKKKKKLKSCTFLIN